MTDNGLVHHYRVLKQFLDISDDSGSKNRPNSSRAARAREKLLRLSEAQFRELSTDVYDELRRRIDESRGEPDYLLPKSSFHPKRNQARQKLSSLPQSRFKDLVSDISYEIERRNLHVESELDHNGSTSSKRSDSIAENGVSSGAAAAAGAATGAAIGATAAITGDSTHDSIHDSTHDSNVSKHSNTSDVPNQTIGVSNKTVVPTKANLTWSSEEEDNNEDDDNERALESESQPLPKLSDVLNGSMDYSATIDELNEKLNQSNSEKLQLKEELEKIQLQYDQTLDKNYDLTKTIEEFNREKSTWDSDKSLYESKLTQATDDHSKLKDTYEKKLQDKTEYNELLKEYEQVKSLNATLRLENQSLKNSVNTSSKDHTRSNSMNTLSKDLDSVSGSGTISPSDKNSSGQALNKQMELILEKLSGLDSKPTPDKKSSFIHLRNDVVMWQKKYEDLKSNKLLKEFNNNLLSSKQLQSLTTDDGLVSINSVTKFHSLIETFLKYLDNKEFNSDLLFEKISSISLLANNIANQGESNRLNSNESSINVRDCASHVLSVTRYFTIYSNILPKIVVERSINELVFSICDLIGKCKLSLNDEDITVSKEALQSSSALNPPNIYASSPNNVSATNLDHSNSSSLYNAKLDDDDNTSIGVRPLKMADRLKNNGSMVSLDNSREISPNNDAKVTSKSEDIKVNNVASKVQELNESFGSPNNRSTNATPTKSSNVLDRVKKFESPPSANSNDNNGKSRTSFSPGSENESTSNSFILNRSSLEMKKSPKTSVSDKFADIQSSGKRNNHKKEMVGAGVGVGIGAAAAGATALMTDANEGTNEEEQPKAVLTDEASANGNGRKGIFQSIRDRFTEQQTDKSPSKSEPEVPKQPLDDSILEDKQDTSTDNILSSTAETTPSKENEVEDLNVSPSKAQIPQARGLAEEEVPSSAGSDATIEHDDTNEPNKSSIRSESENSQALKSLHGNEENRKKVTISNEDPKEIISNSKSANQETEEEFEEDDDSEDEQTTQARQRQEHRKSMAAATFNVDLFDIDDPDNTITQVLLYLEHQTVEVITTIQLLLAAIKKPNVTRGDLRDKSKAIADVISQMTEATNTSMNQTRNAQLKEHGSWVVQNLEDCCHRMNIICKPSKDKNDLDFADRSFKQRLAGISYDIAKCTKELVKAVEEASLKEDIANLDARLSHGDDLT